MRVGIAPGSLVLVAMVLATCSTGSGSSTLPIATSATPEFTEAGSAPASAAEASAPVSAASVTPVPAPIAATYSGTFEEGGTIEFTVSPDGMQVTAFIAEFAPCGLTYPSASVTMSGDNGYVEVPIAIDAGEFTFGEAPSYTGTGQLLSDRTAVGTVDDPGNPDAAEEGCRSTRSLLWKATTMR